MPLSVHCGPFAGLEEAFVESLVKAPPGLGRRVAVVTSSQHEADRLQRLLALDRGMAFFNLRFHTLHTLALELAARAELSLPAIINDDVFHEKLVERLLLEEGRLSGEAARSLAGAHRATLRDLLEAGVDGQSFRDHFSDMDIPGRPKLDRLLALADRYRRSLESINVATSADVARLAAEGLESGKVSVDAYDRLMYYGFYDLNGAQSDFFGAVAARSKVELFFPCDRGHPGWAFAERFLDVKVPLGGARLSQEHSPAPSALGTGYPALFNPDVDANGGAQGTVRWINASGERDELWRVAKEITALRLADPSLRWEDVGVVARTMDLYTPLVPELFEANGIPVAITDGGELMSHPTARLMWELIKGPEGFHDKDALASLVFSPGLKEGLISDADRDACRTYFSQAGPRAGAATLKTLATSPSPDPAPPEALVSFGLKWLGGTGSSPKSWGSHVNEAKSLIDLFVRRDEGCADAVDEFLELLDRLTELDRFSAPVEGDVFRSTLERALRAARRKKPRSVHGVRVAGAMEARGDRFRVLFLIGLKEGVFPRVVGEDPLLDDDLRRLLREPGGYWILPKREGYDEEKLLFTVLTSSARDLLYLSYSRSREDGRSEVPSLYVRDLARALGVDLDDVERVPRAPLEKWNSVPPDLLTPNEAEWADVLEGRPVKGRNADLLRRAGALAEGGGPRGWDGQVGPPDAYWRGRLKKGLSPSAIETMAGCPFQFFLKHVVGLREGDPPFDHNGLLPWAMGQIQHDILHRFYDSWKGADVPAPAAARERLAEVVNEVFGLWAMKPGGPYPLVWAVSRDRVARQVGDYVVKDLDRLKLSGMRPAQLEWPCRGPLSNLDVELSGRLDRIDRRIEDGRSWIIDYKNKPRASPVSKRIEEGASFQGPSYLALVPEAEGIRFDYLATGDCEEWTRDQWLAVRDSFQSRLTALVGDIRAGRFPIRPSNDVDGPCAWCRMARACRKAHAPSRRRAGAEGDS